MSRRTHRRTFRLIAVVLTAGIAVSAAPATALAASPGSNGKIAYELDGVIHTMHPNGSGDTAITAGPDDHSPRWSPNGRQIAFERGGDLWLMRADGTGATRFTSGPGDDITPAWSADGSEIVFVRSDDGSYAGRSMFVKPVAGGRPTRLTSLDDGCAYAPTWTADNKYVVYADECNGPYASQGGAVRKVDLHTGAISPVVSSFTGPGGGWHFGGTAPDVTPDGQRVVFTAASPGDEGWIGVTDLSGAGFRAIVETGDLGVFAADDPAVSPDGRKVLYSAGNETPQLDVSWLDKVPTTQNALAYGNDLPKAADWQPKR